MPRIAAIVIVPLLLQGCNEDAEWYQKTTGVFETSEGLIEVSEVRHVRAVYTTDAERHANRGLPAGGTNMTLRGESVHVRLKDGSFLVALVYSGAESTTDEGFNGLVALANVKKQPPRGEQAIKKMLSLPAGTSASLPMDLWPPLGILSGPPTSPTLVPFDPINADDTGKYGIKVVEFRVEKIAETAPSIELPDVYPCLSSETYCFKMNRKYNSGSPFFVARNEYIVRDDL